VHRRHLTGGALGPLLVAREVALVVALRAAHSKRLRVTAIHDLEQRSGRRRLEPVEPNVLEYLARRLVFAAGDARLPLTDEAIVGFLNYRRIAGGGATEVAPS
jgi:hypothetical protein